MDERWPEDKKMYSGETWKNGAEETRPRQVCCGGGGKRKKKEEKRFWAGERRAGKARSHPADRGDLGPLGHRFAIHLPYKPSSRPLASPSPSKPSPLAIALALARLYTPSSSTLTSIQYACQEALPTPERASL
ncbi:uncharacterized protein FIBRA_01364 [Fibroporia radiculosa]|uniref:Uncharacterized protein n=1 Tax=Fibroporia radiculosa TaxID=599839 RepID=J4I8G0_9APHY|nr:uncharacterized protein FIBRA_01364 [Fibroporia radiculosa]CCL99346.1 predicted protein [Fibroporia radiculosa]